MAFDATPQQTPTDRLELVARALTGVPDNELNMSQWDCGTTACAIGWAIRKYGTELNMGLGEYWDDPGDQDPVAVPTINGQRLMFENQPFPRWDLLGQHLGLTEQETLDLFGGHRRFIDAFSMYPTAQNVVAAIMDHVETARVLERVAR